MSNPVPFNPTRTYINEESIEKTFIAYDVKDKEFSTHDKQTATWIPKFLEKSFIVKIIHWFWNSNERISSVSKAFQDTLNEHIASCKSLKDQATLYANLYTFNRCVIQKHNNRRWIKVPLINFKGLEDTVVNKLDQSIHSLIKIEITPQTISDHAQRLLDCKVELESIPDAQDESNVTKKRVGLELAINTASKQQMVFIVSEINRLNALDTFDDNDFAYLKTLKQLHEEGKLSEIPEKYVEKLVNMEREKKCVQWKRHFVARSADLDKNISTLDPLSNDLIPFDIKALDPYLAFEKTLSDVVPAQKELIDQAAQLMLKMEQASHLQDRLQQARQICNGDGKIDEKFSELDTLEKPSARWLDTFKSWIAKLKDKTLSVDLENYEKAVLAESQARNAAFEKCGAIDPTLEVVLKAPVIAKMLGTELPLSKKYAELDYIVATVRKLAIRTQKLANIVDTDVSTCALQQIKDMKDFLTLRWKEEDIVIAKKLLPLLGLKHDLLLKNAQSKIEATCKELSQYESEKTRLAKALTAMQAPSDFQRYLSLEFFKRHKGFSLYESVQRHLAHRWSDEDYKTKLNNLLKMFPEAILKDHESMHACASSWYSPQKNVEVTEEKIKELAQHTGMPALFQWQMNILSRMLLRQDDFMTMVHHWFLCRALLLKPEDLTYEKMHNRIYKGLEKHVCINTNEASHDNSLKADTVEKMMYIPFIEKVWTTQPTEQDLQSQPKLLLLMTNSSMLRLVKGAYPGLDQTQSQFKLADYLADVHFFTNNFMIIQKYMNYRHTQILTEFEHLLNRIVCDGAAFINAENAVRSMRIIAKAAYQVNGYILEWLKDDKNTAIFMKESNLLSDEQLQKNSHAIALNYCRIKMFSSRQAMLNATSMDELVRNENAERAKYLKEWQDEDLNNNLADILQMTAAEASTVLDHSNDKDKPALSQDY